MSEDTALSALDLGGALDEKVYYSRGWADGLPIIPPTDGRVRAMMAVIGGDPAAESEALSPWEPLHAECGFPLGSSAATVYDGAETGLL